MLHLTDLVDMSVADSTDLMTSKLATCPVDGASTRKKRMFLSTWFLENSTHGGAGDPSAATREFGEALHRMAVDGLAEVIREFSDAHDVRAGRRLNREDTRFGGRLGDAQDLADLRRDPHVRGLPPVHGRHEQRLCESQRKAAGRVCPAHRAASAGVAEGARGVGDRFRVRTVQEVAQAFADLEVEHLVQVVPRAPGPAARPARAEASFTPSTPPAIDA